MYVTRSIPVCLSGSTVSRWLCAYDLPRAHRPIRVGKPLDRLLCCSTIFLAPSSIFSVFQTWWVRTAPAPVIIRLSRKDRICLASSSPYRQQVRRLILRAEDMPTVSVQLADALQVASILLPHGTVSDKRLKRRLLSDEVQRQEIFHQMESPSGCPVLSKQEVKQAPNL